MHPSLSIGFYMIMLLLTAFLTILCLSSAGMLPKQRPLQYLAAGALILFFALGMLPVAGAMMKDSRFKFAVQGAGNIWLGFFLYYGGFLMIFMTLSLFLRPFIRKKPKKFYLLILAAALVLSMSATCYGMHHARQTVVKEYDITIEKPASVITDLNIVLLGDLHLSVNSHLSMIRKMTELVNAQNPDVVVIAGDVFTSSYDALQNPGDYSAVLRQMQAKYGVYAVYGNHDVEETLFGGFPISPISEAFRSKQMEDFFIDSGFTVLYDEMVTLGDTGVQLVGRVDGEKAGDGTALRQSPAEVLSGIDPEKPVIVLQHEPVEFSALKENGADLALCGHTHAGQFFPGNIIVPFFNENAYGYKLVSGLDTLVTSGIGYYGPPMRVGTDSEVTVVHLHFSGDETQA